MQQILLDTDVILDFFFDRSPFSDDAAAILALCEKKMVVGYVTPVIVSNVYYLLSQKAKQDKVLEKLKLLLSILEVVKMDKTTIIMALNSEFTDFEDALQNYTAEIDGKVQTIITRNVKDYRKSKLAVMLPEDFLRFF